MTYDVTGGIVMGGAVIVIVTGAGQVRHAAERLVEADVVAELLKLDAVAELLELDVERDWVELVEDVAIHVQALLSLELEEEHLDRKDGIAVVAVMI